MRILILTALLVVLAGFAISAGPPTPTTSTVTFSPSGTVVEGTIVDVTGSVSPVPNGGSIVLSECMQDGIGVAGSNCTDGNAFWVNIGSGDATLGSFTVPFDSTDLGGGIIGFRSHYIPQGSDFRESKSPAMDLTILDNSCTGLNVSADLASGNGIPMPGESGPWTFRIKVHSCDATTGVFSQGGTNGWAPMKSFVPSAGTVSVRNNNKNQVLRWTLGSMPAGSEQTLLVTVDGKISRTEACNTLKNISGAWSATYSSDGGATFQKSDYTGKVTLTVTCPA